MTFTISSGIPESELSSWLKGALKQYGKYKDGGVDYTNAPVAPVILCTVLWDNQILLLKRGYDWPTPKAIGRSLPALLT